MFVRIKKSHGCKYLQIVESKREGKRVKRRALTPEALAVRARIRAKSFGRPEIDQIRDPYFKEAGGETMVPVHEIAGARRTCRPAS